MSKGMVSIMKKITSVAIAGTMGASMIPAVVSAEEGVGMQWTLSTEGNYWVDKGELTTTVWDEDTELYIDVDSSYRYQTLTDTPFGGCFADRGWEAMKDLTEEEREKIVYDLFSPEGLNLMAGRMPIGNNDYSINRSQSYNELPEGVTEDYDLEYFSIDTDREWLIPYIEAAEKVRPNLPLWGSPWSPPSWMKTNKTIYNGGSLIWEEEILKTYAQYFVKYIEAYREEGHNVYMVMPQNEPTMNTAYASCIWTGVQLNEFIRDYLHPAFVEAGLADNTDIYLGTFTDSQANRCDPTLNDPVTSTLIKGVGFQWWSAPLCTRVNRQFDNLDLMQSETKCGGGSNSWQYAEDQFDTFKEFFDAGVNSYFLWNMVLDEKGENTAPNPWRQCAPIVVDSVTNEVRYNAQYYQVKHFSHYIKPGARRIKTDGNYGDKIAFQNPDGEVILIVKNRSDASYEVAINVDGIKAKPTVPAHSISTFRIMADNTDFETSPDMALSENNPDAEKVTIKLHAYKGGKTLSVHSASFDNGANVISWTDQGTADQAWIVEPTENGYYKLVNYNSLKALGVYGGSKDEGARVVQWDWDQSYNQQWKFVPVIKNGTKLYKIVNRESGLCLSFNSSENDGVQAYQQGFSGDGELWDVTVMTGELFKDQYAVTLKEGDSTDSVISVEVTSKTDGEHTIICAFFNENGTLISTKMKKVTLVANEPSSVTFDRIAECYSTSVYSWDEKTLTPLSKKCIIK